MVDNARTHRWMAVAAVLASLLAAATVLGMLACFFAAIWVHGPDSARFGGTGCLLAFASIGTVGLAAFTLAAVADG